MYWNQLNMLHSFCSRRTIKDLIKGKNYGLVHKITYRKELCTNLNVSRGTVREAFRFFKLKGIDELKTGKGRFCCRKKGRKTISCHQLACS